MNKILLLTILLLLTTSISIAQTQFRATTYEKALALAKKYNKPLLLDVAASNKPNADIYKLFQDKELSAYISKNFVTARISMDNEANRDFEDELNYLIYPCVVFYSNRGEQLESSNWFFLVNGKEDLRELAQLSLDGAAFKAKNSRNIEFDTLSFDQAVVKAHSEDKLVFVSNYYPKFHSYAMIENNVFSQDSVADFYNENFINIRIDNYHDNSLVTKYMEGEKVYPNYMFFDGDGGYISTGHYHSAEEYIANAKGAIELYDNNKRVHFSDLADLSSAVSLGKPLFLCYSQSGEGGDFLRTPFLTRYINTHFTPLFIDGTNSSLLADEVKKKYGCGGGSTYIFTDSLGVMTHKIAGDFSAYDFFTDCLLAIDNQGLAYHHKLYSKGERGLAFIEGYLSMLSRAGAISKREKVIEQFTDKIKIDDLLSEDVFCFVVREVGELDSDVAQLFLSHYVLFEECFGYVASDYRMFLWKNKIDSVTGDNYNRGKYKSLVKRLRNSGMPEALVCE